MITCLLTFIKPYYFPFAFSKNIVCIVYLGFSSLVTNIDFYIAPTDYLYGRCNGKKLYYCKFLFNDVYQSGSDKANFLPVTPSEYNTAQTSVEAVLLYIVDDIRFSDNDPIQSSIDDALAG